MLLAPHLPNHWPVNRLRDWIRKQQTLPKAWGGMSVAETPDLQAPAPPWDYNPSAWMQRIPICVLAVVAAVISSYLALYQWHLVDSAWDPVFGNQTGKVLRSSVSGRMSGWFGIHDAALGAIAYLGDALFGLAGSTRRWQYRPWIVILFGIDVIPLGIVSAILVVIQGAVLGQWCFLCLVTAVISLVLVYWAYDEVWASLYYLWLVWKRTKSVRTVWWTTWGFPSQVAYEVAEEEIARRRSAVPRVRAV